MNLDVVQRGYDVIADRYFGDRDRLRTDRYVSMLLAKLAKNSQVLDIGCGAGIPVDDLLIRKGHLVTGIDVSEVQIRKARKNCPRGDFLVKNMMDLKNNEFQVEAIVSLYALFHIPRIHHGEMLKTWASFLPKGGWMLVTMGDRDFEGFHDLYGSKMWSSHYGVNTNKTLLQQAGLVVEFEKLDTSGDERHWIALVQKQ